MTDIEEFLRESNHIESEYSEEAYEDARKAWDYILTQNTLTPAAICKTHKILMAGRDTIPDKDKGWFRKVPVFVGGREGMNWKLLPIQIVEWCEDVKTSIEIPGKNGKHIQIDHISYEKIHPFLDGNGRTGRIFMNWERLKAGLPILIIKESEKYEYYKWFK